MIGDPENPNDNNTTSSNNDESDVRKKTFFVNNVEKAQIVSQLQGTMVGNVIKSFLGSFISAEQFAEKLKKAGFIVKIEGKKLATKLNTDKNKPRSR